MRTWMKTLMILTMARTLAQLLDTETSHNGAKEQTNCLLQTISTSVCCRLRVLKLILWRNFSHGPPDDHTGRGWVTELLARSELVKNAGHIMDTSRCSKVTWSWQYFCRGRSSILPTTRDTWNHTKHEVNLTVSSLLFIQGTWNCTRHEVQLTVSLILCCTRVSESVL